jgi:hypothetical protein
LGLGLSLAREYFKRIFTVRPYKRVTLLDVGYVAVLVGKEMALCLLGIGAFPSSMGILYSHYILKSQSVITVFFASTEEGL